MYQPLSERLATSKAPLTLLIKLSVAFVLVSSFTGCQKPAPPAPPAKKNTGILKEYTQEISEAKPGAEQADLQAKGMLAAPGAYGFAAAELAKIEVKHAVELYRAETGEYPKDFDTFMNKIILQHGIKLPVMPGERQYQYDVENHVLIVVEKEQSENE